MKELLLLRHGESTPLAETDFKRPLTEYGLTQISRIALKLKKINWFPDIVFSSTALRTQQTEQHLLKQLKISPTTYQIENFYLGDLNNIIDTLYQFNPAANRVLLIGHNNGWSEAINLMSDAGIILGTAQGALLKHKGSDWYDIFATISGWQFKQLITP